jgi:hypothetical protein
MKKPGSEKGAEAVEIFLEIRKLVGRGTKEEKGADLLRDETLVCLHTSM